MELSFLVMVWLIFKWTSAAFAAFILVGLVQFALWWGLYTVFHYFFEQI